MENLVVIAILAVTVLFVLAGLLALAIYLYFVYQKQKQIRAINEQKWQQQVNELKMKSEMEARILAEKLERAARENSELQANFMQLKARQEQELREKTELLAKYENESKALAIRLENEKPISIITSSELATIVRGLPNTSEVYVDKDNDVNFKFRDKDQDFMHVIIKGAGNTQLTAVMPFPMPDDYLFMSVIASNNWNQRLETQNVFAYTVKYDGNNIMLLETDLNLRGGVSRENIKVWLETFISKINLFETSIVSDMQSLNIKDSQLQKNNFWSNLGDFVGSVLGGIGKAVLLTDDSN